MNTVTNANILVKAERRATIRNARTSLKISGLRNELATLNNNRTSAILFGVAVVLASIATIATVFAL